MRPISITAFAASLAWASPVAAVDFHNDDVSIGGKLCVGHECTSNEAFAAYEVISLEADNIRVRFSDTSSGTGSFPNADWRIEINDVANGGDNYYAIGDVNQGTQPFKIRNNAPSHALTIDTSGYVGMGTMLPQSELHVMGSYPELTFEDTTNNRRWLIHAANNFFAKDITNSNIPFHIGGNAPSYSLRIQGGDGNVGLGTFDPEGKLHTKGDGVQMAYFESATGDPVQIRMRTNSQNRRFLAVNNSNAVQSQLIFRNKQVRIAGPTDSGGDLYAIIGPAGIVTQGPTCDPGPCDGVFDPAEFTVPPIDERAAFMWENRYLPAVGPTAPDQPFNLTQKAGGMLHELEVAHVYIQQLHERLQAQEARLATLEAQLAANKLP